jgi:hypothetical protein
MGRSSVYNRLKLDGTQYFEPIGFTLGWGHFHITDDLFEQMRNFLRDRDHRYADQHTFGQGPNWRLRTIKAAWAELEFDEGVLKHGIKRQVFAARLATNAFEILRTGVGEPDIGDLRTVSEISELAIKRWIMPRAERAEIDFASWRRSMILPLITGSMSLRAQDERKLG